MSLNLKRELIPKVVQTVQRAQRDILNGVNLAYLKYPVPDTVGGGRSDSLVNTGAAIFLDQNQANSITPDTRNIVSLSPEATILIKKKAFSSLKSGNDLRFMDKTEKMLLRATKALFAYKVQQIRVYESLTKFENYFSETGSYSLNLLASLMNEATKLDLNKLGYTEDQYVEKRFNNWLVEKSIYDPQGGFSVISRSPGGRVAFDTEDAIDDGDPYLTNSMYLNQIPASNARRIIKEKKDSLRKEYRTIDTNVSNIGSSISSADNETWNNGDFWEQLEIGLSYSGGVQKYDAISKDLIEIIRRNTFSIDNSLTTWIVDPDDPQNWTLGPGTGVIELALFDSFSTETNNSTSPSSASFSLAYPYRIGTILEDDIEMAILEAVEGTAGLFDNMLNGDLRGNGQSSGAVPFDASSVASAIFESAGLGGLDGSLDMDYIRDRMRVFYLGKSIMSPPDPVHFYIRGNRSFENNTDPGLGLPNDSSGFNKEYLQIDEAILKAEYQLYTTQSISYDDYKAIRGRQDTSFGMIHVFGGFITGVTESFSGGFWKLSASCTDNMQWLNWSQYAINPSLSDPKNILEDPVTPYTLVKDELGQIVPSQRDLLHENKMLLRSGLLSYDSGILAGQNATEGNLIQNQFIGVGSSGGRNILQHADGFVYRWKTGIITETAGFQVVDPTGARESVRKQYSQYYSQTIAPDVLNNLDIPNILSILIVGQPYNIETFIEQSYASHNKSSKSSTLSPQDALTGVIDTVRKQNQYFGNFHPYRTNSVSPEAAERIINTAGLRQSANDAVKKLRRRKIAVSKKIRALKRSGEGMPGMVPPSALVATLQSEIDTIDAAINDQVTVGVAATNAINAQDRVGVEIGLFGSTGLPLSNDADENQEINRAMMLVGAQRRIEDVRLNRDKNLLVISDQYDMADIRPFILALRSGSWNLFSSGYQSVYRSCETAAGILNLEFFCNTQGHLEFRPPQWNKTPLTVLKESIRRQTQSGKTVIPSFITNLFQTRIEALRTEVYTLNIQIVLISLMMGRFPDRSLIPNMNKLGESSLKFFGVGTTSSDEDENYLTLNRKEYSWEAGSLAEQNNSLFGEGLRLNASFSESGNSLGGDTETLLGDFDPIFQEQSGVTNDLLTAVASAAEGSKLRSPAEHYADPGRLNNLRDTFKKLYGRDPAKGLGIDLKKGFVPKDFITTALSTGENAEDKVEAALASEEGLLTKLRRAISKRDSFVTMLVANERKVEQLNEVQTFLTTGEEESFETNVDTGEDWFDNTVNFLEDAANNISNTIDIFTGDASQGSVYDHLISDDTRNFLGYGSGKRFILEDDHILSANFTERPPNFTRINIQGNAPFVGSGLSSGTDNFYFWAGATDFDLWRQYGYRAENQDLPFISNVESQARPYAILELGMQKLKVNEGSLSVVGNEFYQPGDTVYIPSKGLLYYVTSVSHSFNYGQSFSTTLSLTYGHPPGDYIPGPLDIIGQELVGNMLDDPALVSRSSQSDDNYRVLSPDPTLIFPSGGASAVELLAYLDNQVRFTNMMIDVMGSLAGNKYLLIRGFVANQNDQANIDDVNQKIKVVRSLFQNPSQISQDNAGGGAALEGILGASSSVSSLFGGGSAGTTMNLRPMRLPNNSPVIPIKSDKIIEQISFLEKEDNADQPVGRIDCLDRKLLAALEIDLSLGSYKTVGIFPKGGPRQGSWSDFRDDILGFSFGTSKPSINIVEVGVIDIPNSLLSLGK